jgi:hypothetical protein
MLHGLVERIAVELRARLSPSLAAACAAGPTELIADLTRAGLLQDEALVALLLWRADIQRLASSGKGGRSVLHRWTADQDAAVAAAAMTLVAARGRGRDRFGRVALDVSELPRPLATGLAIGVAAALGRRCSEPSDHELSQAVSQLFAATTQPASLVALEVSLVEALGSDGRRSAGLLAALIEDGDAPILAALCAAEGRIPVEEAWTALLGGAEQLALLLRLAGVPRGEAAAMLAAAPGAFGIGDPAQAIDAFDALSEEVVEAARAELTLSPAYRNARRLVGRHG